MSQPRRIVVIGNAGAGKSTLAKKIGARFGLEVIHLDQLLWKPDWEIVPEDEFARLHSALLDRPDWVIEGVGYMVTVADRLTVADLVVLTRYSLPRSFWWSLKRELGRDSAGRPLGCEKPPIGKLLTAIWRLDREILPQIETMIARQRRGLRVEILRSPRDIPRLLQSLSGK